MKRMLMKTVALAATMMVLLTSALADAPVYSPEVAAQKLAIVAMYEKYGFTPQTIGVFTPIITIGEDETRVLFRSYFLPGSRLGEYEVVIRGNDATITWNHDGKDLSAWQPGDPECPCWGPEQILAYEAQGIGVRENWINAYYAEGEAAQAEPTSIWKEMGLKPAPEVEGDLSCDEARQIARAAMMDVCGLTEAEVEDIYAGCETAIMLAEDGRRFREVRFADMFKGFSLLVNAQTGEVFHIELFAGGNG